MKKRSRSIGYQLKKSRSREKQLDLAKEWARQWHDDAIRLIYAINDTADKDWDAFDTAQSELRKLMHQKCDALANIFDTLAAPVGSKPEEE